jgi:hypothetical protein
MRTFFGLILLALAILLLIVELMTLADPMAGLRMSGPADIFVATAPWYVHAGWFVVIGITGWASARLLSGGIVGRLVRGRGLTPEPVRR